MRIFLLIILLNVELFAGERFTIPYFPERDLTNAPAKVKVEDITLDLNITPRPIKAMSRQTIYIRFSSGSEYINVENVVIKFNMKMDMGNFVYKPKVSNGALTQNFIVPKCIFLDKRWYTKIEFSYKGRSYQQILFFDVKE
ncbi:MAG: hypothetical protein LDL13_09255 [Calditerrivibrio sp.]|nr:hypothetical protein [Calditerrivibrio sp.]